MSCKPVVLVVLDGWGCAPGGPGNAIAQARTPNFTDLWNRYPHTTLCASGEEVGLPAGQMGNSEVGHLNLGAGRVVYQDYSRINRAISDGSFFTNEALTIACLKAQGRRLHLLGLLSDGGVHSHMDHIYALLQLAVDKGVSEVCIHAFLDGRDVPPCSAETYLIALHKKITEIGIGCVASIGGRYWAMDRDQRWDRVARAYESMVKGKGEQAGSWQSALKAAYDRGETDEFVSPTVITSADGVPVGPVRNGDVVICFNFRPDRVRQLTRSFVDVDFGGFDRIDAPADVHYVCFTLYDEGIDAPVAFGPEVLQNTLGEYLATHGLSQLRIAETEKYAHVTFFFNGGREKPFINERRVLIPSPKVSTYDLKPEMSAYEVAAAAATELRSGEHDVIILNFANSDMVGHTGDLSAAIKAVEAVDTCLGQVVSEILAVGGVAVITSDHGNAEQMLGDDGQSHTAHSCNKVPLIVVGHQTLGLKLRAGSLADVAPTMLDVLGLSQPVEMTGVSLIEKEAVW